MPIVIRSITDQEITALYQLMMQSILQLGPRHYPMACLEAWAGALPKPTHGLEEYILDGRWTFGAFDNDALVGYADLTQKGYFEFIFVMPGYTGGAVSHQLIEVLLNTAAKSSISEITVRVSLALHERLKSFGFEFERMNTVERGGQILQNFSMKLRLGGKAIVS